MLRMKPNKRQFLASLVCLLLVAVIVFWTSPWAVHQSAHPQTPSLPLPYGVEQVGFSNMGSKIRLAGTLTLPRGTGPHPAIVLIPGQGEVDRDGTLFGHQFYRVLADHLTRRGFAVLRSDKRGIGQSGGNYAGATTFDFASDTEAGLAFLRSRPDIDARRIGLLGHSEGGLVGTIVAGRDNAVAFLVLMAGNGVPLGDMLLARTSRQAQGGLAAAERERALQKAVFAAVLAPGSDTDREAAVRKLYLAAQAAHGRPFSEDEFALFLTPWMRTALAIDPQPLLRQLGCPVLALVGDKDRVVTASENIPALERALAGNPHARVERLPGLNHFFQSARSGEFAEVAGIEETMAPRALGLIGDWAARQPGR